MEAPQVCFWMNLDFEFWLYFIISDKHNHNKRACAYTIFTHIHTDPHLKTHEIPRAEFDILMLYNGICDFEKRFKACVGPFHIHKGNVAVPAAQPGAGWSDKHRGHYKRIKQHLKIYVTARNALFHSGKIEELDLQDTLEKLGEIVFWLNGLGTSRPLPVTPFKCPSNWTYPHHLKQGRQQIGHRSVALQVDLALSVGSMEIPIPEDRCFCGRDQNLNNVKKALLHGGEGARVVLSGIPGVGKDSLAAAVLRDEEVLFVLLFEIYICRCLPLLLLMSKAWLTSSTYPHRSPVSRFRCLCGYKAAQITLLGSILWMLFTFIIGKF